MEQEALEGSEIDPRLTFDTFVIGPANRLAAAAASRAADSPGKSYNPLFIYSESGLGKSHILHAIAHHASREELGFRVRYKTLEDYLSELAESLSSGAAADSKFQFDEVDILLLDDVQFLTGQPEAQEMLLRTLDTLSVTGKQVVLASDRPPAEIDALDARLVSRFSGGLLIDIGAPDYETRVAILRRKAEERDAELVDGVPEALARHPVRNVRELGGILNRVLAIQELEGRQVDRDEIRKLFGEPEDGEDESPSRPDSELDELVREIAGEFPSLKAKESPLRKKVLAAAARAEKAGYQTDRLRKLALGSDEPENVDQAIENFESHIERLREIEQALGDLGNPWSEAAAGILRNPDRVQEAEALLSSAQERVRPFPAASNGPTLDDMDPSSDSLPIRAARQLLSADKPEYTPLFFWSRDGRLAHGLLEATARSAVANRPDAKVAVASIADFANDFIRALSQGVAGAWRERWWTLDYLFMFGLEGLTDTERAQEEFFHLFEAMKRSGGRLLLTADRPSSEIKGIDDRLRSRFEGGLALQIGGTSAEGSGTPSGTAAKSDEELFAAVDWGVADATPEVAPAKTDSASPTPEMDTPTDDWYPSSEKAVLEWSDISTRVIEDIG